MLLEDDLVLSVEDIQRADNESDDEDNESFINREKISRAVACYHALREQAGHPDDEEPSTTQFADWLAMLGQFISTKNGHPVSRVHLMRISSEWHKYLGERIGTRSTTITQHVKGRVNLLIKDRHATTKRQRRVESRLTMDFLVSRIIRFMNENLASHMRARRLLINFHVVTTALTAARAGDLGCGKYKSRHKTHNSQTPITWSDVHVIIQDDTLEGSRMVIELKTMKNIASFYGQWPGFHHHHDPRIPRIVEPIALLLRIAHGIGALKAGTTS